MKILNNECNILTYKQLIEYLSSLEYTTSFKTMKRNKIEYINIPVSFDIETSNFKDTSGEKVALMYHWQLAIYDNVITGRTWGEFLKVLEILSSAFSTHINRRLVIYIHNLTFEFSFMKHYIKWSEESLLGNNRDMYYIVTASGIEFRDSLKLSGMSLEKTAANLRYHKIRKLKGDLDYDLLRTPLTPLTDEELQYCYNDVLILTAYISEQLARYNNNISEIPLTKTGEVRKYCRDFIFGQDSEQCKSYISLMKNMRITSIEEYKQLKAGFQGGFTHANFTKVDRVINDVTSYDFTSSYPYVMLSEKFPMGKSRLISPTSMELFEKYMDSSYGCLVDVTLYNLSPRPEVEENILSKSRCHYIKGEIMNNGRVVYADIIQTTITDVDYKMLKKFYTWDKLEYRQFRIYPMDYLPTPFIKAILKLYKDKTVLKGVEGSEVEYQVSKGMLNSCYGMAVTDIIKDKFAYEDNTGDFIKIEQDIKKLLQEYNFNKSRFLFYPWGVWVTAYARRNLFTGILECGNDYCYADTDSIKILNAGKHQQYFNDYNMEVKKKLEIASIYHHIPLEEFCPKTKEGKEKLLGVWDFDGHYAKFKTLGAKRYMTFNDNEGYKLTCAGLNKKLGAKFLSKFDNPFESFCDDMEVPASETGKLAHIYIDDLREGIVTDYKGMNYEYHVPSGLYLEACSFHLSMMVAFIEYIMTGGFYGGYRQEGAE